ncbi:MAG TPA: hypothetical protein VK658_22170 [Chryseolinea sp.]|nr:hypothetical protein [Chryseolinea sp.]
MKKILLTTVLVAFGIIGFAQSNKEEVDLVQAAFGKDKKAMAAEFIQLEGAKKDAFWVAYDEYETKRKELGKKRIEILNKYVNGYTSLDDASTDAIVKEMMEQQTKTDKLIDTYYHKIKKESGVKPAAQFYQFENYILAEVRSLLMENIPLIGEFDKKN